MVKYFGRFPLALRGKIPFLTPEQLQQLMMADYMHFPDPEHLLVLIQKQESLYGQKMSIQFIILNGIIGLLHVKEDLQHQEIKTYTKTEYFNHEITMHSYNLDGI